MKETKEQLIEKVAKLEVKIQVYKDNDERQRKEFAKAFSWHKQKDYYGGSSYSNREQEPILPTWEQIWVNLGTLLAARNFMDFEGNLSELEVKVEGIERNIKSPKQPGHDLG